MFCWVKKENLPTKVERFHFVGVTRFELATPRPPDEYATRLRHTPKKWTLNALFSACKCNSRFFKCKTFFDSTLRKSNSYSFCLFMVH